MLLQLEFFDQFTFKKQWPNLIGDSTRFGEDECQKHGICCPFRDSTVYIEFGVKAFTTFELLLGGPIKQELIKLGIFIITLVVTFIFV